MASPARPLRDTADPEPLFDDAAMLDAEVLRARSRTRWAACPPGVIPLTAAEPDFTGPGAVKDAIVAAVADGYFPYESPEGLGALREAVAEVAGERYGIRTVPEHVVLAPGTAAALWGVVRMLCGEGDECLLLDPVDLLFGQAVDAAGARRVTCPMDTATGRLDPERLASLVTPRTALICLCSPHNPLGTVFPEETLRAVAATAAEHGVPILSDEVWNEIVYPPARHVSTASLGLADPPRVFTVTGLSKSFGLPGLRTGFVIAPDGREAEALRHTFHDLGASYSLTPFAQAGALAALRHGWAWKDAFLAHLHAVRDHCADRLDAMPGVTCPRPDGTFVLFPDVTGTGLTSAEMAAFLLERARVAVVPGTPEWFGPGAEGHIRLSYATSLRTAEEAMDRVERALRQLP